MHTGDEDDAALPFTTTSWYFLDAVDVMAPANTVVVCAFGDSITDGTLSTLNGDDRWPDVLSQRLHAAYGNRVSVVNAGIGGNRILTPQRYPPPQPFRRRSPAPESRGISGDGFGGRLEDLRARSIVRGWRLVVGGSCHQPLTTNHQPR